MSDIIKPEYNENEPTTPVSSTLVPEIPHSGKLPTEEGGERSVIEHEDLLSHAVLTIPDHPGSLEQSKKVKKRSWHKPIAAATVLGIAAGSLLAATRANDSDGVAERTSDIEEPAPNTTESPNKTTPEATTPPSVSSEGTFGNINLSNAANSGNFITAARPNGEQIKVPYLQGDTPNEVANSALSLFACYLTTGSQECKTAFSNNPDIQSSLEAFRKTEVEPLLANPSNRDMQIAIFDDPQNPAVFTSRSDDFGREIYELSSGTLYFGRYIDHTGTNEWQGPETRASGMLESTVRSMSFYVEPIGDQSLTVSRFEWDIQPVESTN